MQTVPTQEKRGGGAVIMTRTAGTGSPRGPDRFICGFAAGEIAVTIGQRAGRIGSIPYGTAAGYSACPRNFGDRVNSIMTWGCHHGRFDMALGTIIPGAEQTAGDVFGMSTYSELGCCGFTAQSLWRRSELIVGATVTLGADISAGLVAGIAFGPVGDQRINDAIHMETIGNDLSGTVNYRGMAIGAFETEPADVIQVDFDTVGSRHIE